MGKQAPYEIETEAGQALWTEINAHNGSSVWGPVGEGLVAVEAEMKAVEHARIITAIKPFISKGYFPPEEVGDGDWLEIEYSELVALIKGEEQ